MEKTNTPEVMFPLVEQWQQSGLSQKQFSEEKNIKYHNFAYWVKRYRQHQYRQDGFIPVELTSSGASGSFRVELAFGNGLVLRIY